MRHPTIPTAVLLALLVLPAGADFAAARPVSVQVAPVPLDTTNLNRNTVGGLRYRGGLILTSADGSFGGLSALSVSPDGTRLVALSDTGLWFTAALRYDRRGDLAGIGAADLGLLEGADGRPLSGKIERDAESMATGADGELVVAFERHHRLVRYAGAGGKPELLVPPMELNLAPANGGIEALTRLEDGRLVVLSEAFQTEGGVVGWVGTDGAWDLFTYETDGGFAPTGATTLPGGDVVVVERNYTALTGTVKVRLRRVGASAFKAGARVGGTLIAELAPPMTVDNFEGVSAHRDADGKTRVTLVSDDNFSRRQRTLLMMFELVE